MKVYGSVTDAARLLPRERDARTGRRIAERQDKRSDPRHRSAGRRRARALAVAGAVVAVLAIAGVAVAVAGPGDAPGEAVRRDPGSGVTTTSGAAGQPPFTDPPATAISLQYRGGAFSARECTDLLDQGGCDLVAFNAFDPLTVRCTPDGCQVEFVGRMIPLDPGASSSTTSPHSDDPACGTQSWTIELESVGTARTHGIEHPARLVGRATNDAPASVVPTSDCLGRHEVYDYDAVPA
jgi:hypothetical protein